MAKPWKSPEKIRLDALRPAPAANDEIPPEPERAPEPPKLSPVPSTPDLMTIETVASRFRILLTDALAVLTWNPGDRLTIETSAGVVTLCKTKPSERRFKGSAVISPDGRVPLGRAAAASLGVLEGGRVLVETDEATGVVRLFALSLVKVFTEGASRNV